MKLPYSIDEIADSAESLAVLRGPSSAGQSGDTQGLLGGETSGSESVVELIEEGQYFEAGVVSGVENAPPADVSEVRTKQVNEDDVPAEYLDDQEPSAR